MSKKTSSKTSSAPKSACVVKSKTTNAAHSLPLSAQLQRRLGNQGTLRYLQSQHALVSTTDGITTFSSAAVQHPFAPEIFAHESAHRAQFRAAETRPLGDPTQLEQDAQDGGQRLLAGRTFEPRYSAPPGEVLNFSDGSAKSLISSYTSWGNLDEQALGGRLVELAWMSHRHYALVLSVLDELGSNNRDDVAYQFCRHANDKSLEEFANSGGGKKMLRRLGQEMQGGWDSSAEKRLVARIWGIVERQEAGATGQEAGEKILNEAAARDSGVTPNPTDSDSILDTAQLNIRLRLIESVVLRLEKRYVDDDNIIAALKGVRASLASVRARISVEAAAQLTSLVTNAQSTIALIETNLTNLDAIQLNTQESGDFNPQVQASLALVARVRNAYVESFRQILTTGNVDAVLKAQRMASVLPRAFTEVQMARLEHGTSAFSIIDSWRNEVAQWVGWTRKQLDTFSIEAQVIGSDIQAGREVHTKHLKRLQKQQQFIKFSIEGLGHWDRVLRSWEYLNTHGSPTVHLFTNTYGAATRLLVRCKAMKSVAMAGDLAQLQSKVTAFSTDENIERWFKALPIIAGVSTMIRSLSITFAAAMASAGVGALFRAGTAGYAAGDAAYMLRFGATSVTSRQMAVFAGSVSLEALAFTATHRGLESIITGETHGNAMADLAWNLGLFTILRLSSLGVKAAMTARGLERAAEPVTHMVAFGNLMGYGAI